MEELLYERNRCHLILSEFTDDDLDKFESFSQLNFNTEYFDQLFFKKRRIEDGEKSQSLPNLTHIYEYLQFFYQFKKYSKYPQLVNDEIQMYMFGCIISSELFEKIILLNTLFNKIKKMMINQLLDGFSILDDVEEAQKRISEPDLLFNEEEKQIILSTQKENYLYRHETCTGNFIIDMDDKNIGNSYLNGTFTRQKYIQYFQKAVNHQFIDHLFFLYMNHWQIYVNTNKSPLYFYGAIQRIQPLPDKLEFVQRNQYVLSSIIRFIQFIGLNED